MKRTLLTAAVAAALLTLAGCGLLDPQQQADMLGTINQLEAEGKITAVMAAAQRELLQSNGVGSVWQQGLGYLLAAASAYFGIQIRRGTSASKAELVARKQAKLAEKAAG
jgi:hypothetical protein